MSQSLLWRGALPAAGLLAGAAVLGLPLLFAAAGALAVGAAVAAGGLAATALFLPFFLAAGLAATFSFGAFAAVFMLPQLMLLMGMVRARRGARVVWTARRLTGGDGGCRLLKARAAAPAGPARARPPTGHGGTRMPEAEAH